MPSRSEDLAVFGRDWFIERSFLSFPGHDNQYLFFDGAERFASRLTQLSRTRPPQKPSYKLLTAQPTLKATSSNGSVKVKPNVLIGTIDDGLYMRRSEIERLGLEYTGREVMTRQGISKVWTGNVTLRFPHDYNGGNVKYHVQHILELPDHIAKAVVADTASHTKKEGILGIKRINRHLVFFHKGDVHLIDFDVLPQLADCFAGGRGIAPLSSLCVMTADVRNPVVDWSSTDEGKPVRDLQYMIQVAVQSGQLPPFNAFTDIPAIETPVLQFADICRTCGRADNPDEGVNLLRCMRCSQEGRSPRALYCSKACQTSDWRNQHKQEHEGTLPWSVKDIHSIIHSQGYPVVTTRPFVGVA